MPKAIYWAVEDNSPPFEVNVIKSVDDFYYEIESLNGERKLMPKAYIYRLESLHEIILYHDELKAARKTFDAVVAKHYILNNEHGLRL